jgi:hypothetical protein
MTDVQTDHYPLGEAAFEGDERPEAFRRPVSQNGAACDEGAAILRDRIAARQWATAAAVASGEQPRKDPDAEFVAEVGAGYRVYVFPADGDGGHRRVVRKTLVDGFWRASSELE